MSIQLSYRKGVSILLMSVLILQIGCRGWIEKPIVPDNGISIPQRGILRVTKTDGAVIMLKDFFITNDSIVGFFADEPLRRAGVARTDVMKTELRGDTTPHAVRVAGRAYVGVVLGLILAVAVTGIMFGVASKRANR
jgi:hypothetical protein